MADETRLLSFEYRTKDGVIQDGNCEIILYTEKINIKGELTRKVFDVKHSRPVNMTGLFIVYEAIEYGSLTTTLSQLLAEIQSCNCIDGEFRLFDVEFDVEFE